MFNASKPAVIVEDVPHNLNRVPRNASCSQGLRHQNRRDETRFHHDSSHSLGIIRRSSTSNIAAARRSRLEFGLLCNAESKRDDVSAQKGRSKKGLALSVRWTASRRYSKSLAFGRELKLVQRSDTRAHG
jgi:hypothetical protein